MPSLRFVGLKDTAKLSKEYSVGLNFHVLQDNATSTLNTLTKLALQKGLNRLDMTSSVTINEVLLGGILPIFFCTNYFAVTLCKKRLLSVL